jgi:integrase
MRKQGNLDVRSIDAAKPRTTPYRLSDGGGLLLEVRPTGGKIWTVRITVAGKRRDIGLGGYPTVSLKDARAKAAATRRLAGQGVDPVAERTRLSHEAERQAALAKQAEARTFKSVAAACIASESPGWKNPRTELLWLRSLEHWIFPVLGDVPVAAIDRAAVHRAIEKVWTTRPATGKKVLRRVGAVLRYAAANGWRPNDNVADARMLRYAGLPALPGGRKQPSLPWVRLPAFMAALGQMPGLAPLALHLVILTALRSGEVRNMRWSWLSFHGTPTLTVPGEAMKSKRSVEVRPHRVPLTGEVLKTLAVAYSITTGTLVTGADLPGLAPLQGDKLVFPSARLTTSLSDMALSAVMRRMNADRPDGLAAPWRDGDGREAVPHGFRASFSTWVDDTRPEEREAAERALAHEPANKVSGAYRRSDLFDRRIVLMQAWSDHCVGLPVEQEYQPMPFIRPN